MADSLNLRLLGSGGWMATTQRATCAVSVDGGPTAVVLDAGTGICRAITEHMPDELHVVLTHFHLDHVVGLSYLPAIGDRCRITVHAPGRLLTDEPAQAILEKLIGAPYLSAPLMTFIAEVQELTEGTNDVAGLPVQVRYQSAHPGGSVGLRVGPFAYCTDTEPDSGTIDFVAGCSALLHEAWTPFESGHGHSSAADVAKIAVAAGVDQLVLCHIHPLHDDPEALLEAARGMPNTVVGHDGLLV